MKVLGSTEHKINKDENGENLLHFEITEVVLVHSNIVNNNNQQVNDNGNIAEFNGANETNSFNFKAKITAQTDNKGRIDNVK